jgi:hypothetical protein
LVRTTAERIGDITLVLVAVAALTFLATVLGAADRGGNAATFWSVLGLSVNAWLFPTFAGACLFCWMDAGRQQFARWALLVLLGLSGIAAIGEVFGGGGLAGGGGRSANFLQDASALLMVAGGVTLVMGLLPGTTPVDSNEA